LMPRPLPMAAVSIRTRHLWRVILFIAKAFLRNDFSSFFREPAVAHIDALNGGSAKTKKMYSKQWLSRGANLIGK